jgi:hypothetical protein
MNGQRSKNWLTSFENSVVIGRWREKAKITAIKQQNIKMERQQKSMHLLMLHAIWCDARFDRFAIARKIFCFKVSKEKSHAVVIIYVFVGTPHPFDCNGRLHVCEDHQRD